MVMVAEFCEYPKNHSIIPFKLLNYVVHRLFLNKTIKQTHIHTHTRKFEIKLPDLRHEIQRKDKNIYKQRLNLKILKG